MTVTLHRDDYREDGIFGHLTDEAGQTMAVTLEHAFLRPDGSYVPKVTPGMFTFTRYDSPKRGYPVWMTNEVPGHSFIEFHRGNYNRDSDGCILLGTEKGAGMLLHSQTAFASFMDKTAKEETITVTVVG